MSIVTIAIVPRDRFSKTALTVRSVLENTRPPFHLVVVDCGMPDRYRKQVELALQGGCADAKVLRSEKQYNSNEAKNWVIREVVDSEYLAFVENDVEVHPGWLEKLIAACEEEDADVARPLIMERKIVGTFPHFDQRLGRINKIETEDGTSFKFYRRKKPLSADVVTSRQLSTVLETHCLLFKRSVFDRIPPFDERLTVRQEVDLALELVNAGIKIVFEPDAVITYHRPPPVNRDERVYFNTRWDFVQGIRSHQIIEDRWKLIDFPESIAFARHRHKLESYHSYAVYYLRYELLSYVRWEFLPNLKYRFYRLAQHFPTPLRGAVQRVLYR